MELHRQSRRGEAELGSRSAWQHSFRAAAAETLIRLLRDADGSEIAEAAAVLPLMFMVLLGIFWFGQAFRIYGTVSYAARAAARSAAAPYCSTCTAANSAGQNAVASYKAAMIAAHMDPALASQGTLPSLMSCNNGAGAPACDAASTNICVLPSVQLSNTGSGGAGACGVSVTFQYPYQFWLPFTSLNQQLIQLPASARIRLETR